MPSHPTSISPTLPEGPQPPSKAYGSTKAPLPPGTHTTANAPSKGGGQKKLSSHFPTLDQSSSHFPTLDQSSKDGLEPLIMAGPSSSLPTQSLNPKTSPTSLNLPPPPSHPSLHDPNNDNNNKDISLKLIHMDQQVQTKDRHIATLNEQLSSMTDQLKSTEARAIIRGQEVEGLKGENDKLRAQIEEMKQRGDEEKKAFIEKETKLKNELSRGLRSSTR